MCAVSWYSCCSLPTIQRRYEDVQNQLPTRTDTTFLVLVDLVDTMSLYATQSPGPLALTGFYGIIRPLSSMLYAAKKDMAVKIMILYVEMLGDR